MPIRFNNPFAAEGNWYKGNLHAHTTNSDGKLSPEETIKIYADAGYHFLALADHYRLSVPEQRSGLLLINGEEINCSLTENRTQYHIVAINTSREIPRPKKDPLKIPAQKMINEIRRLGGEAIIAHPYWSALNVNDFGRIKDYLGIEVFNSGCFLEVNKGFSAVHWDDLLIKGKNAYGFATDDAHDIGDEFHQSHIGMSCIMVRSKKLSVTDIMDAIKKGMFYSSCGPQIKDLSIEDGNIRVKTSQVKTISFIAPNGKGSSLTANKREPITEASFKAGDSEYVRIQCADDNGKMAWTNAIFFK